MKQKNNSPGRVDYVCRACAEAAGGVWPKGHYATFHAGPCPVCGNQRSLASVEDWNWPRGKPAGWRGSGRD
jgi:hypothetical protein